MDLLQPLAEAGFTTYIVGPSALDIYFGQRKGRKGTAGGISIRDVHILWVETEASLVDLSRLFDGISFPGAEFFDAMLDEEGCLVMFHCIEPGELGQPGEASELGAAGKAGTTAQNSIQGTRQSTLQGAFRFELCRGVFQDPYGAYPYLRGRELRVPEGADMYASAFSIMEAALLMARFGYTLPGAETAAETAGRSAAGTAAETAGKNSVGSAGVTSAGTAFDKQGAAGRLSAMEQRFLLTGIITGAHSASALQFLMDSGFIAAHWPLLAEMDSVHHSKEFHPEGNVWKHTLETFSHRKVYELALGLGLLLHDCGKSYAQPQGGNRFDQHAQIGSHKAGDFLYKMQFPHDVIEAVEYLVRHHMMPSAVESLPTFRTEEVMASPLFPELLELYRCDVSSTFRGPDGYYQACKTYRSFLKNRRNPFRTSDGKKRLRLLVE